MKITLRRAVPLDDLAEMLSGAAANSLLACKVTPRQAAARYCCFTRHWGAYAGDHCVAAGGLYAHLGGPFDGMLEAWFACRPEAAASIQAIARQARLTLRLIADAERVEIFARVAKGWEPGRRLARAVGLVLLDGEGAVERWGRCQT